MSRDAVGDWLKFHAYSNELFIDLGLERCRTVMSRLNIGKIGRKVITVAGTNGKGSSVAILESILVSSGYSVGAYTSPHLNFINERIKLNRAPISDDKFINALIDIKKHSSKQYLTYFELITLAAFKIFSEYEPDYAILEVGLGGRLDAVNCIDADITLITSIDLDHKNLLGNTREEIGLEKAGVMRAEKFSVCSDSNVPNSILSYAKLKGAKLSMLGADFSFKKDSENWSWWNKEISYSNLPINFLTGYHQLQNASGVLQTLFLLKESIEPEVVEIGLKSIKLKGRFQSFSCDGYNYIFDVAHNPEAAKMLARNLECFLEKTGKIHAIICLSNYKDVQGFLKPLIPLIDFWYFPTLETNKMATPISLQGELKKLDAGARSKLHEGFEQAVFSAREECELGDFILVSGSFLTIASMSNLLEGVAKDV